MTDNVIRVSLPLGGWWDLTTRPLWRHVRHWMDGSQDGDLLSLALASLTAGWSFPEGVTERSLALMARNRAERNTIFTQENGH